MKTDFEKIRAAEASDFRQIDGVWYRKAYCSAEEQRDLAGLEAQNEALPEGVRYDSGRMGWYRLEPVSLNDDDLKGLLLSRVARDIRHVKKLCIAILAVLGVSIVAAVLYVIFHAREALG